MNVTDLHITAVEGMKSNAQELQKEAFQASDHIKKEGEIAAYDRVLRYLKNMNDLEANHNVSLAESLAKMEQMK